VKWPEGWTGGTGSGGNDSRLLTQSWFSD